MGTAVGLVAAAALLAAGVVRVTTPTGTLEIETDDPNVEVVVKKDGVVVRDGAVGGKVREYVLTPGKYSANLADPAGGLTLTSDQFEITRDGKARVAVVRVVRPPAPPAPAPPAPVAVVPPPPGRAGLAWVLAVGGSLELVVDGRTVIVGPRGRLPAGAFEVVDVALGGVPAVDDTLADKLRDLPPVHGRLVLDHTALSDAGLAELVRCPGLRAVKELNLNYDSRITGVGLAAVRPWGLKTLHLGFCARVGDEGMAHLAGMPALTWVGPGGDGRHGRGGSPTPAPHPATDPAEPERTQPVRRRGRGPPRLPT